MNDKEFEKEIEEEQNRETYEDCLDASECCPKCGAPLEYVCISSDADGNRQEWRDVCPNCD